MYRVLLAFLVSVLSVAAFGQVLLPESPQPIPTYSLEDKDWNIEPTTTVKRAPYHAPTPTAIPGARVIKTMELKALLELAKDLVVIDVLDSRERKTVPGALWMSGAGDGQFFGAEISRFATALERITDGNKSRPIVFLCLSSECWLSYNASLHALEAGYKDIIWYRGGTAAWNAAKLKLERPAVANW